MSLGHREMALLIDRPSEWSNNLKRIEAFQKMTLNPAFTTRHKFYTDPLTVERTRNFLHAIHPQISGVTMSHFLWHWDLMKSENPATRRATDLCVPIIQSIR